MDKGSLKYLYGQRHLKIPHYFKAGIAQLVRATVL